MAVRECVRESCRFRDGSNETLYQEWFHCEDLGSQLQPVMARFFASEAHRTGAGSSVADSSRPRAAPPAHESLRRCRSRAGVPAADLPANVFENDSERTVVAPVPLREWAATHAADRNAYIFGGPDSRDEYSLLVVTQVHGAPWCLVAVLASQLRALARRGAARR
jgi:hypothetical protein